MNEQLTPEAGPDNDEKRELAAWLKLKRKAVRERDEAREDLKITQEAWVKAKAERADALRKRDEAREEAEHWKTEYEIVVARLHGEKHPRDNGIISEHEIIPKLTRERDEAREDARLLAERLTRLELDSSLALAKLERERNKLKKALEGAK